MRAMVLNEIGTLSADREALVLRDWPEPEPGHDEVLIRVATCGVCHTELDEIEGRAAPSSLPMIPGHQVVGRVVARRRDGADRHATAGRRHGSADPAGGLPPLTPRHGHCILPTSFFAT